MILNNPYKRLDVFQCRHESHADFRGRVSPYHVLREKKCYPDGCISFIWDCTLLNKGKSCIHRYRSVGKSCKGCTYFIDDKIHFQPECIVDAEGYEQFLEDLETFETWMQKLQYKRPSVAGRIQSVKPHYKRVLHEKETHTQLRGYLLVIRPAYIGTDAFQDTLYIRISEGQMNAFRFVPKMKLECTGEIRLDRGRLILFRPGRFEIVRKGWGTPWTRERALVSIKTAKQLESQPTQCLACPWGALVDTEDLRDSESPFRRRLFCLKGVEDYRGCYVRALKNRNRKTKDRINPA
jgi:hypothetical protein